MWARGCDFLLLLFELSGGSSFIEEETFYLMVTPMDYPIWHCSLSQLSKSGSSHTVSLLKHMDQPKWFLQLLFVVLDFSINVSLFNHAIFSASSHSYLVIRYHNYHIQYCVCNFSELTRFKIFVLYFDLDNLHIVELCIFHDSLGMRAQ